MSPPTASLPPSEYSKPSASFTEGQIIGNAEVAKIVGDFIRCTNIREATPEEEAESSSLDAGVDFTIILGRDFDGRYVVPSRR